MKVFISYRRQDSEAVAGRMADFLAGIEDVESVFFDYDAIAPGENFVEAIDRRLAQSTHVFVLIGPRWTGRGDDAAPARIFDADDMVRREVLRALACGSAVVPVLLDDMRMPGPAELPEDLRPMTLANAYPLRNARFRQDMLALLARLLGHDPALRDGLPGRPAGAWRQAVRAAAGALAGFVAFLLCSAVMQYGFGLTSTQLFDAFGDEETAQVLWRLVLAGMVLAGAAMAVAWGWRRRGP